MSEADRSLPAREARVYESLALAPTAAAYGVGPAWINGGYYFSDGVTWNAPSNLVSIQSPKNYDLCCLGDSLSLGGVGGPGTSTNSITVSGGVCTFDNGSAIDLGVGQTFMIDRTADENLNMRQCVVTRQLTRNKIEFTVNGYTPPDGTIAKSAASNITIHQDQTYRNIQGVMDWTNYFLGGPFNIKFHLSRNGYRVDELYVKVPSRITDIAQCGWAYICIGINSVNASDSYGTMPQVWAQMESIYNMVLNAGTNILLPTLPPVTTATWNSSDGRRPRLLYINNRIRKFARDNPSRVVLVDVFRTLADPATIYGEYLSNTATDGLHIGPRGAVLVAKTLSARLQPLMQGHSIATSLTSDVSPGCGFDTLTDLNGAGFLSFVRNILDNPSFAGTGGTSGTGITGTTPTNWTTGRTGSLTATLSSAIGPLGSNYELTAAITSTAAENFTLTQSSIPNTATFAGRKVRVGMTFDVSSATALKEILVGFDCSINNTESGTSGPYTRIGANNQGSSTASLDSALSGRFTYVTQPFVMQNASTHSFSVTIGFWGVGGATVKMSNPFVLLDD